MSWMILANHRSFVPEGVKSLRQYTTFHDDMGQCISDSGPGLQSLIRSANMDHYSLPTVIVFL